MKIAHLSVAPPLVLAPMAGVTDRDFRLLVRRIGGIGVVTMEFLSSRELVAGHKRAWKLMTFAEEERPLSIQIYGSDAATMAEAARIVEASGADLCDINMGCPANKVLKGCAGAALMGDLDLAEDIVRQVRRAITIPLTVKFRLGLDDRRRNYLELGRICEANGADAVAMHARTAKQMFRGEPEWPEIARLKETLSIPVLGNGDVREPEDALRMLRETGCDGVMIGRGATRNPWIFRQIAARLGEGSGLAPPSPELESANASRPSDRAPIAARGSAGPTRNPLPTEPLREPTLEDRRELMLGHFRTVVERENEGDAMHKLRTFTKWYSHGLPRGLELRRQIQELPDTATFLAAIESFFDRLAEHADLDADWARAA